ncbi:MAG: hypothetical protein ROW48_00010 [Bellilinea sp.]|jgi:hypothetical protein
MMRIGPKGMMLIGVGLMLFGVAAPFLMILRLIETSLWLNFVSYIASISGLVIAFLGLVMYVRIDRR